MKKGCLISIGVIAGLIGLVVVVAFVYVFKVTSDEEKARIEAFNQSRPEVLEQIEKLLDEPDPSAAFRFAQKFSGVTDEQFLTLYKSAAARHFKHEQQLQVEETKKLYGNLTSTAGKEGEMIKYDSDSSIEVSQLEYVDSELTLKITVKNDGIGKEFLPSLKLIDIEGREFKTSENSLYVGFAPGKVTKSENISFSIAPPYAEPLLLVVKNGQAAVHLEPIE